MQLSLQFTHYPKINVSLTNTLAALRPFCPPVSYKCSWWTKSLFIKELAVARLKLCGCSRSGEQSPAVCQQQRFFCEAGIKPKKGQGGPPAEVSSYSGDVLNSETAQVNRACYIHSLPPFLLSFFSFPQLLSHFCLSPHYLTNTNMYDVSASASHERMVSDIHIAGESEWNRQEFGWDWDRVYAASKTLTGTCCNVKEQRGVSIFD